MNKALGLRPEDQMRVLLSTAKHSAHSAVAQDPRPDCAAGLEAPATLLWIQFRADVPGKQGQMAQFRGPRQPGGGLMESPPPGILLAQSSVPNVVGIDQGTLLLQLPFTEMGN